MRLIPAILAGLIVIGAPAAAKKADAPIGFSLKAHGTLQHKASGTRFPMQIAGFTRSAERAYDLTGKDAAVAYREKINGEDVVARIALLQIAGMTPKEHYLGMQALVGQYFQGMSFTDVAPRGEGPFDPPGLTPGSGYQGRFSAKLNGVPYELSLSTVKLGKWDVRLTAAYPAASAGQAQADVLTLAAGLQKTAPKQK